MDNQPNPRVVLSAIIVSLVLFTGVFVAFRSAQNRPGTIVLPGGITYLGPTPTTTQQKNITKQLTTEIKIPVPKDAKWVKWKGQALPYAFLYPDSLSLGFFPEDPYDSVTIFYADTDPNTNIFFRVEDLVLLHKSEYKGKTKDYANNWWKDYLWNGASSIVSFTNSNGLQGYRAKYIDQSGNTPYDHVFFSIPENNTQIIWISGRLFPQEVFDKIIDSVTWE